MGPGGGAPRTDENLSSGFSFLASFRVALSTPGPAVLRSQRPLTLCSHCPNPLGPPGALPAVAEHLLGIALAPLTPGFTFSIIHAWQP